MENSEEVKKTTDKTEYAIRICLIVLGCLLLPAVFYWISPQDLKERTILSLELVCKTANAHQLQQDFDYINLSSNRLSDATKYLLKLPRQYFSARTFSKEGVKRTKKWDAYYSSLVAQATKEFSEMNMNSRTLQNKGHQNQIQYVVVKLLVALQPSFTNDYELPRIKTFQDVIRALRTINSIPYRKLMAEDFFWTHPLNNTSDIPSSLNLVVLPELQV